jgi:glycine/D-amino acid oxidase-like deaminating enzyme
MAAATLGIAAKPAKAAAPFDDTYDIVVCGSGCGGLASSLFARWQGNSAVILEKAGSIGGTTAKAAFWYWVPNNEPMKKAGILDPKPDFLKYVARLTNPTGYDRHTRTTALLPGSTRCARRSTTVRHRRLSFWRQKARCPTARRWRS